MELFNDVLQGRPSVKTLAMREAAEAAEAAEIADEVRTPNTAHALGSLRSAHGTSMCRSNAATQPFRGSELETE